MQSTLLIKVAASIAVVICASVSSAQNSLTLTMISGAVTNTYADSGSGFINTGSLTINNWQLPAGVLAYSQPFQGDAGDDYVIINVGSLETSGHVPALIITATETGFAPFTTTNATLDMVLSNSTAVSGILTGKINGTRIGTLTTANGAIVTNLPVSIGLTSTFSMTETLAFGQSVSPAPGSASGDLYPFPVPEPSTWVLLAKGSSVASVRGGFGFRSSKGLF